MNCALILHLNLVKVYSVPGIHCGSSSINRELVKLRRQRASSTVYVGLQITLKKVRLILTMWPPMAFVYLLTEFFLFYYIQGRLPRSDNIKNAHASALCCSNYI